MNRVTVELGINRLQTEIAKQRQTVATATEQLEALDIEYRSHSERYDLHGEPVGKALGSTSAGAGFGFLCGGLWFGLARD